MIDVMVNGCNGKMGQIVCDLVDKNPNMILKCGADKVDTGYFTYSVYTDLDKISEKPDVIIDFSIPVATFGVLEYAKKNNVPVVIATTGFTGEEEKKIVEYSNYIPVFKSANMSFSINMFQHILKEIAPKLKDTDIEIIETHHNRKIDSPSGTALMLADSINETLGNKLEYVYDRHDKKNKRSNTEIGIHSVRGGTEVGKHSVIFFSEDESLEITHNVKAAKYIINKKSGMYNMKDLLKEEEKYEK